MDMGDVGGFEWSLTAWMDNYYFCWALIDLVLGLSVPTHREQSFVCQVESLCVDEPSAKFDLHNWNFKLIRFQGRQLVFDLPV